MALGVIYCTIFLRDTNKRIELNKVNQEFFFFFWFWVREKSLVNIASFDNFPIIVFL